MTALWPVMILAGFLTYGIRLSFILLFGRSGVPPRLRRALRLVPAAVLPAIIFPELLMYAGTLDLSLGNARLLAGLVAILIAWRTRNAVLTILAGLACLYLLQTFL